jgi:phosphopentomutase
MGVFHHWKDFGRLLEKGSANQVVHHDSAAKTTDAAVAYWKQQRPALLFVHRAHVDHAGAGHGWGSPEYTKAVVEADSYIGRIAEAAPEAAIVVTADHGGAGTKHGGLSMDEIEIPWIAAGPGIRKGLKLAKPVNTYDTAVTVAYLLRIKPHECWTGRPVWEALE